MRRKRPSGDGAGASDAPPDPGDAAARPDGETPAALRDPDTQAALRAYVKLMRAARAIETRLEPDLHAAGLTPTQFGVLEALLHKGPLTQVVLGRKLLTSPGNVTDVIAKLVSRGFVARGRKPGDRRAVWIALTEAGRAHIADLFPRHAAAIAAAMAGLSAPELDTMGEMLRTLGQTASGAWEQTGEPDPLAEENATAPAMKAPKVATEGSGPAARAPQTHGTDAPQPPPTRHQG